MNIPVEITAARQSASSSICKLWRLERLDGVVLRFTEHDSDLEVDGELFKATASFSPSTLKASADLSVGDLDVHGAFDNDLISPRDVLAGLYNGASFWVAETLWDNPGAGKHVMKFGWLGNIREQGPGFVAELCDPTRLLNRPILDTYTPGCRATLGDGQCGVDLGPFTHTGTVVSVSSGRVFTVSGVSVPSGVASYFQFGVVTFTGSGVANHGLSMEIKSFDGVTLELMLAMPFQVSVGDTLEMVAGCSKSLGDCVYKFSNKNNFRGFPHVPVSDSLLKGITPTDGPEGAPPPMEPAPDDGSLSG